MGSLERYQHLWISSIYSHKQCTLQVDEARHPQETSLDSVDAFFWIFYPVIIHSLCFFYPGKGVSTQHTLNQRVHEIEQIQRWLIFFTRCLCLARSKTWVKHYRHHHTFNERSDNFFIKHLHFLYKGFEKQST